MCGLFRASSCSSRVHQHVLLLDCTRKCVTHIGWLTVELASALKCQYCIFTKEIDWFCLFVFLF